MFATSNPTLSQPPRPDSNRDRQALAGALAALSTLAVAWVRRNGAPPSQEHWQAVELAQLSPDPLVVRVLSRVIRDADTFPDELPPAEAAAVREVLAALETDDGEVPRGR